MSTTGCTVFLLCLVLYSTSVFASVLGPTNTPIGSSTVTFIGQDGKTPCKACEIPCSQFGIFTGCEKAFYRYGCHMNTPCLSNSTIDIYQYHAAVSFCLAYNKCKFLPFITSADDYMAFVPFDDTLTILTNWLLSETTMPLASAIERLRFQINHRKTQVANFLRLQANAFSENYSTMRTIESSAHLLSARLDSSLAQLSAFRNGGSYQQLASMQLNRLARLRAEQVFVEYRNNLFSTLKPRFPPAIYIYYHFVQHVITRTISQDDLNAFNEQLPPWFKNMLQYYDLTVQDYQSIVTQLQRRIEPTTLAVEKEMRIETLLNWLNTWSKNAAFNHVALKQEFFKLTMSMSNEEVNCVDLAKCTQVRRFEQVRNRAEILKKMAFIDTNANAAFRSLIQEFASNSKIQVNYENAIVPYMKELLFGVHPDTNKRYIEFNTWHLYNALAFPGRGKPDASLSTLLARNIIYTSPVRLEKSTTAQVSASSDNTNSVQKLRCNDRILIQVYSNFLTAKVIDPLRNTYSLTLEPASETGQEWVIDCNTNEPNIISSGMQVRIYTGDRNYLQFAEGLPRGSNTLIIGPTPQAIHIASTSNNPEVQLFSGISVFWHPLNDARNGLRFNSTSQRFTRQNPIECGAPCIYRITRVGTTVPRITNDRSEFLRCGDEIYIQEPRPMRLPRNHAVQLARYMTSDGRVSTFQLQASSMSKYTIAGCFGKQIFQPGDRFAIRSPSGKYLRAFDTRYNEWRESTELSYLVYMNATGNFNRFNSQLKAHYFSTVSFIDDMDGANRTIRMVMAKTTIREMSQQLYCGTRVLIEQMGMAVTFTGCSDGQLISNNQFFSLVTDDGALMFPRAQLRNSVLLGSGRFTVDWTCNGQVYRHTFALVNFFEARIPSRNMQAIKEQSLIHLVHTAPNMTKFYGTMVRQCTAADEARLCFRAHTCSNADYCAIVLRPKSDNFQTFSVNRFYFDNEATGSGQVHVEGNGNLFIFSDLRDFVDRDSQTSGKIYENNRLIFEMTRAVDKITTRDIYSDQSFTFNCKDTVTLHSVPTNKYLTNQRARTVFDFNRDDESQLFTLQCDKATSLQMHDRFTLANSNAFIGNNFAMVTQANAAQVFMATPPSRSLDRSILLDGSVVVIASANTTSFLSEKVQDSSVQSNNVGEQLVMRKVGVMWCAAYLENYIMRVSNTQRVQLRVTTNSRAWVTIDDKEVATDRESRVYTIDISNHLLVGVRAKLRVYYMSRCGNTFTKVELLDGNLRIVLVPQRK